MRADGCVRRWRVLLGAVRRVGGVGSRARTWAENPMAVPNNEAIAFDISVASTPPA